MRAPGLLIALALASMMTPSAEACSFFLAARDGKVLAGNNEDWEDPNVRLRFVPRDGQRHGYLAFSFANGFPQGGMNERGLFFDGAATAYQKIAQRERPAFEGHLVVEALRSCATVDEVVALFQKYRLAPLLERAQLMFGDARGDAVIIEGEALVRKRGEVQICTNFYQSRHRSGPPPCARYRRIQAVLSSTKRLDHELMRRALIAGHQRGRFPTVYSNIYDLEARRVTIYQFHDFETPVRLDLAAELKKGARSIDLASLFPKNPALEARKKSYKSSVAFRFRELMQTRGFEAAVADYRRLKARAPERFRLDEQALLEAAALLRQDGDEAGLERFLAWMLAEPCPRSAKTALYLGECRLRLGRHDAARRAFLDALKLGPAADERAHIRRRLRALTAY